MQTRCAPWEVKIYWVSLAHTETSPSNSSPAVPQCSTAPPVQHPSCPRAGEEPWPCTAVQLCWPNVPTFQVLRVLCCHGAGPMQTPWLTWLTTQRMNILLTPLQCDPDAQLLCAGLESKQYIWGALDLFQNR